jgi:CheY-like chemotaxis protein
VPVWQAGRSEPQVDRGVAAGWACRSMQGPMGVAKAAPKIRQTQAWRGCSFPASFFVWIGMNMSNGSKPAGSKPTIFVVDDEPIISTTLAAILNSSGFTATAFTDPVAALRSAEAQCPEFLISDVVMPQLNGIDLGVQFKAIYPQCRILLFSGQAATADLMRTANEKGHNFDLLAKPVHPTELLAAIQTIDPACWLIPSIAIGEPLYLTVLNYYHVCGRGILFLFGFEVSQARRKNKDAPNLG